MVNDQAGDGGVTINEAFSSDATLSEVLPAAVSVPEAPSPDATLREEGENSGQETGPVRESFRGWPILEQLPTRGAEADIYIVRADSQRRVLKLYRHRLEPKAEILSRVAALSRTWNRHFVFFADAGFDERTGRWYELLEYMPLGSLRDVPQAAKRDEVFIREMVSELSQAIHCLHENDIVHCDIKPPNVLVRSLNPPDLVLGDFGISSFLASDASSKMTSLKGTPMYWAPEAFSRMIGRPCDWWGLGMMTLELLAGEHPFEGLMDSQIIQKLTLGNADIPRFIDLKWSLLLKGLLTKDDSKRWGYAQVERWLGGALDIPVYYEETGALSLNGNYVSGGGNAASGGSAFRFDGAEYFSAEELARAFAASEVPWASPSYLRYVRQWFESNMMFGEAEKLGSDMSESSPELAMFRFVHSNAACPFCLLGKVIDHDNLRLFVGRTARLEASDAERRVVGMLASGQLMSFYGEYVKLSGADRDPFLYKLLLAMDKKTAAEQWSCLDAIKNPHSYTWPGDAVLGNDEEVLDVLAKMRTQPLKRDDFEAVEGEFILPAELLSMLRRTSLYAEGAELFNRWKTAGLLMRKGLDTIGYENLSLDDYARIARVRCYGHSQAALESIELLAAALQALPPPADGKDAANIADAAERLLKLKEVKITQADSIFISKAAALLKRRTKFAAGRLSRYCAAGGAGGLAFWVMRIITGDASDGFFITCSFFSMVIAVILGAIFTSSVTSGGLETLVYGEPPRPRYGRRRYNGFSIILPLLVCTLLFSFSAARHMLTYFPNLLSFLVGTVPGCALNFWLDRRASHDADKQIADACASYLS